MPPDVRITTTSHPPVNRCWASWTLTAFDPKDQWAGEIEVRGLTYCGTPMLWVAWLATSPGAGGRGVGGALVRALQALALATRSPEGQTVQRVQFKEVTSQGVVDLLERVVGPLVEADRREAFDEDLRDMVPGPRPRETWYGALRRRSPAVRGPDGRWSISGRAAAKAVTLEYAVLRATP